MKKMEKKIDAKGNLSDDVSEEDIEFLWAMSDKESKKGLLSQIAEKVGKGVKSAVEWEKKHLPQQKAWVQKEYAQAKRWIEQEKEKAKEKKAEKEAIRIKHPGYADSWYKNQIRNMRKQRTADWAKSSFNIDVTDYDVADAIGIAYYANEELTKR